jgi:hypothetical protein
VNWKVNAMTRKTPLNERKTPAMKAVPETVDGLSEQIVKRPDGYYWTAPDGKQDFGPFPSYEDALADMQAADLEGPEPGESLQEAESELGIADWIDPETGEPPEGHSPPHLDEE